ncbi:uncharacterized protein LOC143284770 isoform X2 [Babylonia areolata]|uniref:uncharacterized protein LOC143284770 isoform X2 n=1 Tax=Babylonia areolata TaxID=304850 RepID=UPI003FCF295B
MAAEPKKTSKQLLYAEKFGVLRQVKAFLPKLKTANEQLKNMPQEELDIENVSADYDGPVIEMDLALVPNLESDDSDTSKYSEEESDEDGDEKDNGSCANHFGPSISDLLTPFNDQRRGKKRTFVLEELDKEEESPQKKDGK